MRTVAATPAGGWWVFLIFLVVFFFALVYGLYIRRGRAINLRRWRPRGCSAEGSPPSLSHDITHDVRNWSRGARRAARRPPSCRSAPHRDSRPRAWRPSPKRSWRDGPGLKSNPRRAGG